MERPWVFKDPGCQTISLGLWDQQRGGEGAVTGGLSVCAATERPTLTSLVKGKRKQERGAHRAAKMSVILTAVDKIACSLGVLNHTHVQALLS